MRDIRVCWLSAGVSSFIAGYIADKEKPIDEWIYIDVPDQHPDSMRFIHDIEDFIGKPVTILRAKTIHTVDEALRYSAYIINPRTHFAPCTTMLKKDVRKEWEYKHLYDNITYIWGFDRKEQRRADNIVENNPFTQHEFPLIEKGITKRNCHAILQELGIKRPIMYDMGYPNNNCIGCVRGGMGYWNKIRVDFPEIFKQRAKTERLLGHSILKDCYLDELDPTKGNMNLEVFPVCGVACSTIINEIDKE